MIGTKISLFFLAAAVLLVSAHEQQERHRPGSSSSRPSGRPNGYGNGNGNGNGNGYGNGYNQGHGHQRPTPPQQIPSPYPGGVYPNLPQVSPPYVGGQYVNPNLPQIIPPYVGGPYVDPSVPQISPPGPYYPQYPNPSLPQGRPQGPPPFTPNPAQFDEFINRSRLDLDDIRAKAERNINDAQQVIARNDNDIYMLAENDVKESVKFIDILKNTIDRANGIDEELLNECIQKTKTTIEQCATYGSERTKNCIETANSKAIATIDRAEVNLALDTQQANGKFEIDAGQLRNSTSQNNRPGSMAQLHLINRNVAQFASDASKQVEVAQAAANQHSADSAVCRSLQNQNQRDTKALGRELVNNCIAKTPIMG